MTKCERPEFITMVTAISELHLHCLINASKLLMEYKNVSIDDTQTIQSPRELAREAIEYENVNRV